MNTRLIPLVTRWVALAGASALFLGACGGQEDLCLQAAQHASGCTGVDVEPPGECGPDQARDAELILSMDCDDINGSGKEDSLSMSIRCSWVGRRMGSCNRTPADDDVIVTLGQATDQALSGPKLDVVVWNLHKGEDQAWDADMSTISARVDFVVAQEFYLDEASTRTFQSMGDKTWTFATSFKDDNDKQAIRTGVVTGSRVLPSSATFRRSPGLEPVAFTHKVALFTTYSLADSQAEFMVLNVHAINFRGSGEFKQQMDQLTPVLAGHDGPLLVAGDFNTWSASRMDYLDEMMQSLGLAHIVPADDHRDMKLDHVYLRGLGVRSARFLNRYETSDHKPILVQLSVL